MNESNDSTQEPVPAQAASVSIDLKRRMRELLSIPDSQRSEDQWDELIEIEIQLAPGNRVGSTAPRQNDMRGGHSSRGGNPGGTPGGGGNPGGGGGAGGGNWKRHGTGRKGKPGGGKKPPQPNPAG